MYDILIVGGEVYDGSGGAPVKADVAISGDKIAKIGQVERSLARRVGRGLGTGGRTRLHQHVELVDR